jgi:glucose-6-phosphate isomerase
LKHHHDLLLANCLAQSEALMKGRTLKEAKAQMLAKGMKASEVDKIAPHRVFPEIVPRSLFSIENSTRAPLVA